MPCDTCPPPGRYQHVREKSLAGLSDDHLGAAAPSYPIARGRAVPQLLTLHTRRYTQRLRGAVRRARTSLGSVEIDGATIPAVPSLRSRNEH